MPSQTVLNQIANASVLTEQQFKVPAEVLFAQCALESGWLEHSPNNNCFGIKYYQGAAGQQLLKTHELFNQAELSAFLRAIKGRTAYLLPPKPTASGRRGYLVQDWFATFHTLADCFAKRAQLITAPRYIVFFGKYQQDHDLTAFINAFAPVYATDADYARELTQILAQANVQGALALARKSLTTQEPVKENLSNVS